MEVSMQSFRWVRRIALVVSLVAGASCVGEPPGEDDTPAAGVGVAADEIVHGRADRTRDPA
jgi:hypothetical protein